MDRNFGHETVSGDSGDFDARLDSLESGSGFEGIDPTRELLLGRDFTNFYNRSWLVLLSYARRWVADPYDGEEVVQEAFLRLFKAMPDLENEGHALAFMRKTIRNLCIDRFRRSGRRPIHGPISEEHQEIPSDDSHIDPVVAAEDAVVVREALSKLKWEHRVALIAWEIEGVSTAEIAQRIGVEEKNVKHTLNRARAALRRLLVGTTVDPGIDLSIPEQMSIAVERAKPAAIRGGTLLLVTVLAWQPISRLVLSNDGAITSAGPVSSGPAHPLPSSTTTAPTPRATKPDPQPAASERSASAQSPTVSKPHINVQPAERKNQSANPEVSFSSDAGVKALVAPRLTGQSAAGSRGTLWGRQLRWNYSTLTSRGVVVIRSDLQLGKGGMTWLAQPLYESHGELVSPGSLAVPTRLVRADTGEYQLTTTLSIDPEKLSVLQQSQLKPDKRQQGDVRAFRVEVSVSSDFSAVLGQRVTAIY